MSWIPRRRNKPRRTGVGGMGQKKSHVSRMYRDGRIVLSPHHWNVLRYWVWWAHEKIFGFTKCCICGRPIDDVEELSLEHPELRGLGGGRRDDRAVKPAHFWCNTLKGSRRAIEAFKPCPPKPGTERAI